MQTSLAGRLAQEIHGAADKAGPGGEANLRQDVQEALKIALTELGLDPDVRLEKTLRTVYRSRRADAVYPALIIEYKSPGLLRRKSELKKAIEQLKDGLTAQAGDVKRSRKIVGVALDGHDILFVRASAVENRVSRAKTQRGGGSATLFQIDGPASVTEQTVERLLRYFRYLSHRFLTPDALADDFGSDSEESGETIRLLVRLLRESNSPKVVTLFDEWKRLFGIVYGEGTLSTPTSRRGAGDLGTLYKLDPNEDISHVLFAVHTYFALVMKLVAAEVLARSEGSYFPSFSQDCLNKDDLELGEAFRELESGGLFSHLGIVNFLEGDFFAWYLSEWNPELAKRVRALVVRLSEYDTRAGSLDPTETRDILKHLYQYLVPGSVRHDLGEYYTPDWLADLVLEETGYRGEPGVRLLDPACGSGTFLSLAIGRAIGFSQNHPELLEGKGVLQTILNNIVGFDINPIAVLAARTNYLIAIAGLPKTSHIELPVYLCDSVLTPQEHVSLSTKSFSKETSVGTFEIPASIASKGKLERVFAELDSTLSNPQGTLGGFLRKVETLLTPEEFESSESMIRQLHHQMSILEKDGKNRIWTRILRNAFAPLHVGHFDLVTGNPPWINWESLAEEYRRATTRLWIKFGLVATRGSKQFELGKKKQEFATLFTLACANEYLNRQGRLGFVITQSVFKGEGNEGFRRFRLDGVGSQSVGTESPDRLLKPIRVHDLVALRPFGDVANRTAVLLVERGGSMEFPVPYILWRRAPGKSFDNQVSIDTVRDRTSRTVLGAVPIVPDDSGAPWLTLSSAASKAALKVLGTSGLEGHAGASTWLNGVYWIELIRKEAEGIVAIRNLNEVGDTEVEPWVGIVEQALVWPLLRGRDVRRWNSIPSACILLPHTPSGGWKPIPEPVMEVTYPRTFQYLSRYHGLLVSRSGHRQLRSKYPFYAIGSLGRHTFAPTKVVWHDLSSGMEASVLSEVTDPVLGRRLIIPDHHVFFVNCSSEDEAHFLTALLNSTPSSCIAAHVGTWSTGTKFVNRIRFPKFNPNDPAHEKLRDLSRAAHTAARVSQSVDRIEEDIDNLAAELWGLLSSELSAMRSDLERVRPASTTRFPSRGAIRDSVNEN